MNDFGLFYLDHYKQTFKAQFLRRPWDLESVI